MPNEQRSLAAPSLPSRDEAIRILKGGLGKALQQVAAQYVMPISWVTAHEGKPLILANGSAFLLDCGAGAFGVTARHVIEGFRRAKARHADAKCMLADLRLDRDPIERLIAEDAGYDVATFHVLGEEIDRLRRGGKIVLTGSQTSWPPDPPQVGRGAFFVGFPGVGRTMLPYRGANVVEIIWDAYTALATAESVSPTTVSLVLQHDPALDVGERDAPPADGALAGCSGAPLLTFVERNGVFSWRLGGVINEAREPIVRASRADCLNSDGTINCHPDLTAYRRGNP